ncbi:mitochondrial transport complex Tim10, putative [Babesia bigemina]|uniref:Mitochondrial import inner membrane translocase subunit n=1 Tax=Babesia bigemina TaxID=5866 RepID=A0A061D129_BABBI|nr:mitochondrial transport complex Tim10, putative [Babesia bigemina]CDR94328.1 mitochondrial transport complex Tim10, putative [Babesia bigemina]|eukprot:XP_012766514.1 mitochondrial transport complex Tim10, putative [Babesia bigemina]
MDAPADPVNVAVAELVGMADMLKRMRDSCWSKCIAAVKVERMDPGEQSCVDRCVNKFLDVHTMVGTHLQEASKNAQL